MSMLPILLQKGALLPLVKDLINFLRTLTRSFFYEFEIQNSDLVVIESNGRYEFMMVN